MALPEMAPGGKWLSQSSDRPPVYVVNADNIEALLRSGWVEVADPRIDATVEEASVSAEEAEASPIEGV